MNDERLGDTSFSIEGMSAPADYNTLLMYQIGRINVLGSKDITPDNALAYEQAILELEAIMTPYQDDEYHRLKNQNKPHEIIEDDVGKFKPRLSYAQAQVKKAEAKMKRSRQLFSILMGLCARNNFFPGKRIGLKAE